MLSRPRVRLRRVAAWAAMSLMSMAEPTRNGDGSDWRERDDFRSQSLAGATRTFSDEIPGRVAGTFLKFAAMNGRQSSLMLHIRDWSRIVLYRSQPTNTIGGAGCKPRFNIGLAITDAAGTKLNITWPSAVGPHALQIGD